MQNYCPGSQGLVQCEFVQMSSMRTTPGILDTDYFPGDYDIENFLPISDLPLHTETPSVPGYIDQHTRPELFHSSHPIARSNFTSFSEHHSHDYVQPNETALGMPQGPPLGPVEFQEDTFNPQSVVWHCIFRSMYYLLKCLLRPLKWQMSLSHLRENDCKHLKNVSF